jgi:purine nucleoside permease
MTEVVIVIVIVMRTGSQSERAYQDKMEGADLRSDQQDTLVDALHDVVERSPP